MTSIINRLEPLIVSFLGSKSMSHFNKKILNMSLRARGFNNYIDSLQSGEDHFVKNILNPTKPKLCVDIGANRGDYTRSLLQSTEANIISFEPMDEPFAQLCSIQTSYQDRLVCVNKGIGAANGTATIHFSDDASAHASFAEEVKQVSYVKNDKSKLLELITLDSYFSSNPVPQIDFIKIDTEGYESEVLKGGRETIQYFKPKFIQIEYNWHQLFRNNSLHLISQMLPQYEVYQLLKDRIEKRDPKDALSNIYQFSNFVFVRMQ
jgi:FkbM family methyltransferase